MLYKYPRTPHLPWSPGRSDDDKALDSVDHFVGHGVEVSLKMDGECSTLYSDHLHARSIDSADHPSRHWLKSYWAQTRHFIPKGWRVCGENLFAKHSIYYDDLESYFLCFSVWNQDNVCVSATETDAFCSMTGFVKVPVIFSGAWSENMEEVLAEAFSHWPGHEGYVVREGHSFHYDDFADNVAKFVRKDHVQTDKHWMNEKIIKNGLINKKGA